MEKKAKLLLYSGIITLIATFYLSWFTYLFGTINYANGIGGIKDVIEILTGRINYYRSRYGETVLIYIMVVVIIWLLASGILQLIGINNYKVGIIGSILPILIGLLILLHSFNIPFTGGFFRLLELFGDSEPFIEGAVPLHIVLPGRTEAFGTYILLLGGILGLIGSIKNKSEF